MEDYKALYMQLFNGITDAIEHIERMDYGQARERLIRAQADAEKMYIEGETVI